MYALILSAAGRERRSQLGKAGCDETACDRGDKQAEKDCRSTTSEQRGSKYCRVADPRVGDAEGQRKSCECSELAGEFSHVALSSKLDLVCGKAILVER